MFKMHIDGSGVLLARIIRPLGGLIVNELEWIEEEGKKGTGKKEDVDDDDDSGGICIIC